jgi:hypothetical protein
VISAVVRTNHWVGLSRLSQPPWRSCRGRRRESTPGRHGQSPAAETRTSRSQNPGPEETEGLVPARWAAIRSCSRQGCGWPSRPGVMGTVSVCFDARILYQRPLVLTHEEWANGRRYESLSARGRPPTPRAYQRPWTPEESASRAVGITRRDRRGKLRSQRRIPALPNESGVQFLAAARRSAVPVPVSQCRAEGPKISSLRSQTFSAISACKSERRAHTGRAVFITGCTSVCASTTHPISHAAMVVLLALARLHPDRAKTLHHGHRLAPKPVSKNYNTCTL